MQTLTSDNYILWGVRSAMYVSSIKFKSPASLADNSFVEFTGKRERTRAGAYAWRQRQRRMLPWAVGGFSFLAFYLVLAVLALAGYVPLWLSFLLIPTLLVGWFLLEKATGRIDARWGEGARGEFRVGEELERLYKQGFYVFHDGTPVRVTSITSSSVRRGFSRSRQSPGRERLPSRVASCS